MKTKLTVNEETLKAALTEYFQKRTIGEFVVVEIVSMDENDADELVVIKCEIGDKPPQTITAKL